MPTARVELAAFRFVLSQTNSCLKSLTLYPIELGGPQQAHEIKGLDENFWWKIHL